MSKSKAKLKPINSSSQSTFISSQYIYHDDDDDFQTPTQSFTLTQTPPQPKSSKPIKPSNSSITHPSKKPKKTHIYPGKENLDLDLGLESVDSTVFKVKEKGVKLGNGSGYLSNSIELVP
ncbi:hypothetical protein Tco_1023344 [Tanacetum coccineum]